MAVRLKGALKRLLIGFAGFVAGGVDCPLGVGWQISSADWILKGWRPCRSFATTRPNHQPNARAWPDGATRGPTLFIARGKATGPGSPSLVPHAAAVSGCVTGETGKFAELASFPPTTIFAIAQPAQPRVIPANSPRQKWAYSDEFDLLPLTVVAFDPAAAGGCCVRLTFDFDKLRLLALCSWLLCASATPAGAAIEGVITSRNNKDMRNILISPQTANHLLSVNGRRWKWLHSIQRRPLRLLLRFRQPRERFPCASSPSQRAYRRPQRHRRTIRPPGAHRLMQKINQQVARFHRAAHSFPVGFLRLFGLERDRSSVPSAARMFWSLSFLYFT